jgi:polyhydroxyalkanoate synthesis regulator phasin
MNEIEKATGEIVMYQPDETIRLEVRMEDETVWLTQAQMAELFQRDQSVIARHISNVFKEEELTKESNMQILHNTLSKYKPTTLYNLDVIISVGYRVKSKRGTMFRQWANKVLKEYLLKGYVVNKRIEQLEQRVSKTEEKINFFVHTSLPPVEGIFYDGQIFDAYRFASDLVRKAKKSVVLIDNYIDDTVLSLLDKRADNVKAMIYTQNISHQLQLDINRHNAQYAPIEIKMFNKSHDRFLLIDDEVYHIGASLKDLGKKWFAFTLLHDIKASELLNRI